MDGAKVSHLSYVGDSILGENVNFGAGSIVANLRHDEDVIKSMHNGELVSTGRKKLGVVLSDNVKVGVKTLFYPGRKMWPGTVTLPGEIIKKDVE